MSYAAFVARKENEVYNNLKKGNFKDLTVSEERDIEILSILEKLGYPMSHLGTYLYKDLITLVCDEIEDMGISELQSKNEEMLDSLNNGYSNLYIGIASDDKELGCKTFHSYIEGAIEEIDEEKIDTSLASRIYGTIENITYGTAAMHIAQYYLNGNTYDDGLDYSIPKVKKLSNMNDIKSQSFKF